VVGVAPSGELQPVQGGAKGGEEGMRAHSYDYRWGVWLWAVAVLLFAASGAFGQVHEPKLVWGSVTNSDDSVPVPGDISFTAHIQARPWETLNQTSPGCGVETVAAETQYYVECGNFATQWQVGDVLVIEMQNSANGESKTETLVLDDTGQQRLDVKLAAQSIVTDRDLVEVPENGTETFGVKLNTRPGGEVVVTVSWLGGDGDVCVLPEPTELLFNAGNWDVYQDVTLSAAEDTDACDGEATIHCSATGWASKDVRAVEQDNDRVFVVDQDPVMVPEGGDALLGVKLGGQPCGEVEVTVSWQSGDTDIYVDPEPTLLLFDAGNWDTYQYATLGALDDADSGSGIAIIRCGAPDWTDKDVTAREMDNDGGVEHGVVWADHNWTTVNLTEPFTDPIVVAGPPTTNGYQPGVVRIRNVTANSFEIRFEEWDYLDGYHAPEEVHWLAVERGTWELAGGGKLIAGTVETAKTNVYAPDWVEFPEPFDSTPVVLAQVMTFNGSDTVADRICSAYEQGFYAALQEQESKRDGHCTETIGYVAVSEGVTDLGGYPCQVRLMPWAGTQNPSLFVGSQGQCLVRVEEEQSADSETTHTIAEDIGFVSLVGQPPLVADLQSCREPDPCALRASLLSDAFQCEHRAITFNHQWKTVSLSNTYVDPVVVVGPATYIGSDPGVIRIRNVTPSSFQIRFDEWDYLDGYHFQEWARFLAVERGAWDIGGGRMLLADELSTDNTLVFWPTGVGFAAPFAEAPVVVATQQTAQGYDAVTERLCDVDGYGFSVALQEEEAGGAYGWGHCEETVGYVAIGPGGGGLDGAALDVITGQGDTVAGSVPVDGWEVDVVEERSWDDETWHQPETVGWFLFGGQPADELDFLADMQTCNGIDPCSLRCTYVGTAFIAVAAEDEDGLALPGIPLTVAPEGQSPQVIETAPEPVKWIVESGTTVSLTAPASLMNGQQVLLFDHWELDSNPAQLGASTIETNVVDTSEATAVYHISSAP